MPTLVALIDRLRSQPIRVDCSVLHRRLLDWIDRVDYASQRGEPKPPFVATDGGTVFPCEGDEMEHTWFLTEMSKRKMEAAQNAADAIEEGHDTDEEEDDASDEDVADKAKQDNQLLSDDDPLSPFSCDDLKSPFCVPQLDTVTTEASTLRIGRSIETLDMLASASQGDSGASGSAD